MANSFAMKTDISRDILSYLSEYPRAQDTVEGIVHWWLLERRVQRWTTRVEAALTELVTEGLLLERKDQDQRSHYRVNQAELETIRSFLNQERSSAEVEE
jgi:hypothetical protein